MIALVLLYLFFFFFNDTATTEIYTLSLHDALPISCYRLPRGVTPTWRRLPRRHRSEEHTSELQSHSFISYAVFCLKKKKQHNVPRPPSPLPPGRAGDVGTPRH